MTNYLLANLFTSLLAVGAIFLLRNAPARLRFYIIMFAIICWFIPWGSVYSVVPLSPFVAPYAGDLFNVIPTFDFFSVTQIGPSGQDQETNSQAFDAANHLLSGSLIFIFVLSIGAMLFVRDVYRYHRFLVWNKCHSEQANHLWEVSGLARQKVEIRVGQRCDMAMATGVLKPVIWLNEKQLEKQQLKAVLLHELTHIKQKDLWWIWVLTLAQSLFWWNPLVRLLSKEARKHIELSCDERCQALYSGYSLALAQIIAGRDKSASAPIPVLAINHNKSINIMRLKQLAKKSKMKVRYALAVCCILSLNVLATSIINTGYSEQQIQKESRLAGKQSLAYNPEIESLRNEILVITSQIQSQDVQTLAGIYDNLVKWNDSRSALKDDRAERVIKLYTFTSMSFVLDKLMRYQEIIRQFDVIYAGIPKEQILFEKHHLATAYLKMGSTDKAIELMETVIAQQQARTGSVILLARAYVAANNPHAALKVLTAIDQNPGVKSVEKMVLELKRLAYNQLGEHQKAAKMKARLVTEFGVPEQWHSSIKGLRMSWPLLPLLSKKQSL